MTLDLSLAALPPPGVSVILCWWIMRVPRKHFEEDNDDCSECNGTEYNLTVPGGRGRGAQSTGENIIFIPASRTQCGSHARPSFL